MFKVSELSKKKRRRRPREFDGRARVARLQLEREIFRPRLCPLLLRLPPDQLQRIDDERRVAAYGNIPSRCATIRMLIDEGLSYRRAMRPKSSGPAHGKQPFPIEI
jgi:hypothetical protein